MFRVLAEYPLIDRVGTVKQATPPDHTCVLCRRHVALTLHHLIPRKVHRRRYFRKHYTRDQLNAGILICRLCHRGLHKLYDEMQLAKNLSTLELLLADPLVAKHVSWVARQRVAYG